VKPIGSVPAWLAICLLSIAASGLAAQGPAHSDTVAGVTMPSRAAAKDFILGGQLTQGGWLRGKAPVGTVSLTLDGVAVPLAADGSFFAAFDRDASPAASLSARLRDGGAITRDLSVSPRDWQIERVNVPRKPGGASEDFMATEIHLAGEGADLRPVRLATRLSGRGARRLSFRAGYRDGHQRDAFRRAGGRRGRIGGADGFLA